MMPEMPENISRMNREDVKEKLVQMPTVNEKKDSAAWEDDLGQMMGKYFSSLVANGFTRDEALQLTSEFQARFLAVYVK